MVIRLGRSMGGNRIFLSPTHQNQAYCSTFLFTETDTHSMHVTIRLKVEMEAGGRITNPLNYLKWFFFMWVEEEGEKKKHQKKLVIGKLLSKPVPQLASWLQPDCWKILYLNTHPSPKSSPFRTLGMLPNTQFLSNKGQKFFSRWYE